MGAMSGWWGGLTPVNQYFYMAATFFSVILLWQLIMTMVGLSGGDDMVDTDVDHPGEHDTPSDAAETILTFKLLTLRSVMAFFTLFTWAGALYLNQGLTLSRSMIYGLAWGLGAMVGVSLLFHALRRTTETGNIKISSAIGSTATVYLDIPENGEGEIRTMCDGVMTHIKARATGGMALKSGTAVKVTKVTGTNAVEVEKAS